MDETSRPVRGNDLELAETACSSQSKRRSFPKLICISPFLVLVSQRLFWAFVAKLLTYIIYVWILDVAVYVSDNCLPPVTNFSFYSHTTSRAMGLEFIKVKLPLCLCALMVKIMGESSFRNSSVKRLTWPFHSESVRVLNTLSNK